MARVQLQIDDPANRITLKMLLEQAGHSIVDSNGDVLISDDARSAVTAANDTRVLLLAGINEIPSAVNAMREGVYGYIILPLQPGEAEMMVIRATTGSVQTERPLTTLENAEEAIILDTLRRCHYNQAEAARILDIGRNTLWRKLKKIKDRESTMDTAS